MSKGLASWRGWVFVALAAGCDPVGESLTTADAPATTGGSSGPGPSTDGGGGGGGTTEAATDGGTGSPFECDPVAQTGCPSGQKCNHYSMGGGLFLDGTKCVPLAEPPKQLDEACAPEGGYGSGLDDCDAGLMCWQIGPANIGTCMTLCDSDDLACPDGTTCGRLVGVDAFLCLPVCDPLAQDCIEGAECTIGERGFGCAPDKSGDEGQIYDACKYANSCDPGLACAKPEAAPGCKIGDFDGCCVPFCEVGVTLCPDDLECLPVFEPADFPQFETFGVCIAPG